MSTTTHLPLLERVSIASPCAARWEDMAGDDVRRHCAQCNLDVHNLSAMSNSEAEGVLAQLFRGRVCARFYRRRDGTIVTRDCPIGVRAARVRVLKATARVAAALGLVVLAGAAARAAQDKSWGNWGWSVRLRATPPVRWVAQKVEQAKAKYFPPVPAPAVVDYMGDVAIAFPPAPQPPVSGMGGLPLGPHEWEYRE